jgi:DNA-binding response OmpR family regulator
MVKILIAEDEKDIRDLIQFTLKFAGYQVVTAVNGEQAVEHARAELPDLIMMDVRMPKMTVYEACEMMKKDEKLKDIPVIFLSAKGQDQEVQAGIGMGAVDYIVKPFSPDQLTSRVKELLKKIGKA